MSRSVWTVQALYEHTDQRFDDLEQSIEQRFTAQGTATRAALVSAEKAVEKAEQLATTRANDHNQLLATVNDMLNMYKGERSGVSSTLVWVLGTLSTLATVAAILEAIWK